MRPSGSLCTREPAAWGEICIIRIIRCRGRSLEDAAWISLSSRVSLLLSHVPDVTPAVRTVRRRCFSLASQPRAPLCSATAGASGSPSQGSSPQLDTRSEAPPPGGPARRLAQGPPPRWAPRPRPPGSAASCNTCGRFLIASGRPASCGRGRAGPRQGRLWFRALDSPFEAPSLWALPSRSGLAPPAHAQIPPLCGSNWFRHPRGEELNAHIHREEDELRDVVTPRPQGARSGASVHRPQDGTGRVETWPEPQRPLWPPRPSAQAWPPGTHTPWGSRVLGRPPACRPLTCHAARLNALFLSFGVSQDQVARVTSL